MTTALDIAKELINDYCQREFDDNCADFTNLERVGIAYTTDEETDKPIQVNVDLVHYRIETEYDNLTIRTEQYSSLEDMNKNALKYLDFNELISISNREKAFANTFAKAMEESADNERNNLANELSSSQGTDKYYVNKEAETVTQVYFNPDSDAEGQLVFNVLPFSDIEAALNSGNYSDYFSANSKQYLIDTVDDSFINTAKFFLSDIESFNNKAHSVEDELRKIASLKIQNDYHCGHINDEKYVEKRFPVMSDDEKKQHIDLMEMKMDYSEEFSKGDFNLYLKLIDERTAKNKRSLISVEECGVRKHYENDGYSAFDIMRACSIADRPYAALARCGTEITETKYAEIQQSKSFSFSVDINFDNNTVQLYQSHNASEHERTTNNSSIATYSLDTVLDIVNDVYNTATNNDTKNRVFLARLELMKDVDVIIGHRYVAGGDDSSILDLTDEQNIGRN